jgi:hypothetical protein
MTFEQADILQSLQALKYASKPGGEATRFRRGDATSFWESSANSDFANLSMRRPAIRYWRSRSAPNAVQLLAS